MKSAYGYGMNEYVNARVSKSWVLVRSPTMHIKPLPIDLLVRWSIVVANIVGYQGPPTPDQLCEWGEGKTNLHFGNHVTTVDNKKTQS